MTRLAKFVRLVALWLVGVPIAVSLATLVFLYEFYVVPGSEQVEISTSSPEVVAILAGFTGVVTLSVLAERTGIEKAWELAWSYIHGFALYGRRRIPRLVTLSMLKLLHEVEHNAPIVIMLILASPVLIPGTLIAHFLLPWLRRRIWEPLFKESVPKFWLTMNSHVYSRLEPMEPSIRLLQLDSGHYNDPIICQLVEANVHEAEFEAVSYAWGGHLVLRRKISVNGYSFFVTENVIKALRYLRRTDETRVLWIDQMCINQLDAAEKTDQVAHKMHLVYGNAAQVIAWLGVGSADITWAFERAMKYPGKQFEDTVVDFPPLPTPDQAKSGNSWLIKLVSYPLLWLLSSQSAQNEEELEPEQENANLQRYRDAWENVFWRKWFRRIWIIQETALARHLIMKCGDAEIGWDMLKRTASDLRTTYRINTGQHAQALLEFTGRVDLKDKTELVDLAIRFRKHESTDPRDKLIGLLALARDGQRFSGVGYAFHDRAVFANFTMECIQRSQSLEILGLAETRGDNDILLEQSMCSWALDWASNISHPYCPTVLWGTRLEKSHVAELASYDACGGRPASCRREQGPPIPPLVRGLLLRGWHEDSIKAVSVMGEKWSMLTVLPIWAEFVRRQMPDNLDLRENFETVITAELLPVCRPQPWGMWYVPQEASESKRHTDVSEGIRQASFILENLCSRRRLFVTGKGRLGIGPPGTSVGDEVCILEGSAVPLILRRWRDMSRFLPGGDFSRKAFDYNRPYCYVGQAVINNLMYTSSEDISKRVLAGDIIIRDIWLR